MKNQIIPLITLLTLLLQSPLAHALEGGFTADSNQWNDNIRHDLPSEEERARELNARESAIQQDIERLKNRLRKTPAANQKAALHQRLRDIAAQNGWAPEINMVLGNRDIRALVEEDDTLPENFLECILQLQKDLKARGADMIFMPLPPTPHVYGHLLVNGITPEMEYSPGWTRMMLTLLENDIEVIDPLTEYRKQAGHPLVINWPNDFHTADGGRLIAARLLAERMQRYGFAREWKKDAENWTLKTDTITSNKTRISVVNSKDDWSQTQPDVNKVLFKHPIEIISDTIRPSIEKGMVSEVALIGDSQLHSAVHGAGWPDIAMSELGRTVRWGSKSGGIAHSLSEIYLSVVPDYSTQPRVVVVTTLAKYFWKDSVAAPRKMPELGATNDEGIPKARFDCVIEFTALSERPTEDADELDYKHAFFHHAAKVVDGPESMIGKEIGLRFKCLHKGKWVRSAIEKPEVGKQFNVRIWYLPEWTKKAGPSTRSILQQQVFDTVNQDLLVPVFMIADDTFGIFYLSR